MITIRELLEEAKKNIPTFKEGQCFEILRSIYPSGKREERNIVIEGIEVTKPLAVDKKMKKSFKKDSPFYNFFKNKKRGDVIKVVEVIGEYAKCENLSLNEEIKERYYKNNYVFITYEDIIGGTIKRVYKNINKLINE